MKVSFFIDRPVFSAVISILIVIIGIIGLMMLPIDQYPQITPPVVKISASYPGASAVTVSQAVATPIEQELNGTPGMLYMESNSSNSGGFSATVTFDISADPDLAAVEIQNRIKLAESRLPAEVIQNGISVEKQAASQLMTLCLTSDDPKFDEIYLSNFATLPCRFGQTQPNWRISVLQCKTCKMPSKTRTVNRLPVYLASNL